MQQNDHTGSESKRNSASPPNTPGNISSLAVRRGVTFSMLYLIIAGFGVFSLLQLKLDLFPELQFPTVAIVNSYAGVNPEEIETLVTRPLEMAIASVKNVKKIRSTSKQGNSLLIVDLEWGSDIDKAMMDMREKIDIFKKTLPEEARQPFLFAFDPSLQPIMLFSISSNGNMTLLRKLLEQRFSPMLENISGVASAQVAGGQKREIQVLLDPRKLKGYNIPISQVLQSIRLDNIQVASGRLKQRYREISLRTVGTFKKIEDLKKVVIGMTGKPIPNKPVYLWQVADIKDTHKEMTRIIEADGRPGMIMLVQKRSDANTVQTANRILKRLPKLKGALPEGTELKIMFDQSQFITQSLSNLTNSAFQAFFLAMLVLLFFLRSFRSSLIIGMSIPVSIIATFAVMYSAGVTLNIISMAGLALAVGMLVDNSIVVLESIYRYYERGDSPKEASIKGSKEVLLAITASTLTTLAVFVPIIFVPGLAGLLFHDMVITICFSLMASLIVAITLIPLLSSRLLKPIDPEEPPTKPSIISSGIERMLNGLESVYLSVLSWSLYRRKTTLFLGILSFVVALSMTTMIDTEFLPKNDDSMIMLRYERSPGTSLEESMRSARKMEKLIRAKYGKTIDNVVTEAGIGEGFIALFGKGSHAGMLRIRLIPLKQRTLRKWEIEEGIRGLYTQVPGVKFKIQSGAMLGGEGDIVVQLFGHNLAMARTLSAELKKKLTKIPGTQAIEVSLEKGQPELQISLKRDKIRALGLNAYTVGNAISNSIKGTIASLFRQDGNEYNIILRLQKKYRRSISDLENLNITTPLKQTVTLKSIANLDYSLSPVKIDRQDQQRVAKLNINVSRAQLGSVLNKTRALLEDYKFPIGFSYSIGGQAEDFIDSFKWLGFAILLSMLLVYMVMASQFESLFEPFVIIFSIPLALIGVLLALVVTGSAMSVMALIGLVMLVGIVVNNAIVFVDYIKQLRATGEYSILDATHQAGKTRLRPILMTALTTIFGMIPLALGLGEGAESWAGLGRVVIGGLLSSTLLTLLIVPTLYCSLALFAEKRKAKKEAKRKARIEARKAKYKQAQ